MKRPARKQSLVQVIILMAAVLAVGAAGYVKLRHHPKPAVSDTAQTVASVRADAPAQPATHTDAGLQQIVDAWASRQPFATSVTVQELDSTKRTASKNPDTTMVTASTYKLYVAYAVLHLVEQGIYTMGTTTRTGQTVSAALNKMILQSDNSSAEALGFLVGWDRVNTLAAGVGATHTNINNYNSAGVAANGDKHSTAGDLTALITQLQQGTLLNVSDTQLLLGLMKTQVWRERIPAGVPAGIAIADKPGWLDQVQNDAAIVYGPKSTYTLVIMTAGSSTAPLAELSRQIYAYLQQ